MRQISATLTTDQVRDRSKTETRRIGWRFLKVGDRLEVCKKLQGRRRADGTVEPIEVLAHVEVVALRRERLDAITAEAVAREGFPKRTPTWFIRFFCDSMKVSPSEEVTVITWRYLD